MNDQRSVTLMLRKRRQYHLMVNNNVTAVAFIASLDNGAVRHQTCHDYKRYRPKTTAWRMRRQRGGVKHRLRVL